MKLTPQIRLLRAADVPSAFSLSTLADWNQTAEDWGCLLQLAPESCFCVEIDGNVAATATLLCYGQELAWIGMVLTHPEHRRQGLARRLLAHVIEHADKMGTRTLKLDATEHGLPLYEQFGFVSEQRVERWSSQPAEFSRTPRTGYNLQDWLRADLDAFGADRSNLLNALLRKGNCFLNDAGYLLTRAGRNTMHLGPLVAMSRESTRDLLESAIASADPGAWSWDLLPSNKDALALATELGFSPARRLVRMSRGAKLQSNDAMIFATAGFEFG
ncbi:MAG TPA: GNAT family N-acetyltransferase [Terriglobales bacterium]|nr:GNAT family N-acetyltransferase [Terriglobales bacterium]